MTHGGMVDSESNLVLITYLITLTLAYALSISFDIFVKSFPMQLNRVTFL